MTDDPLPDDRELLQWLLLMVLHCKVAPICYLAAAMAGLLILTGCATPAPLPDELQAHVHYRKVLEGRSGAWGERELNRLMGVWGYRVPTTLVLTKAEFEPWLRAASPARLGRVSVAGDTGPRVQVLPQPLSPDMDILPEG